MGGKSNIVSIRLDDSLRQELEECAGRAGRTIGEYAKKVVIASLQTVDGLTPQTEKELMIEGDEEKEAGYFEIINDKLRSIESETLSLKESVSLISFKLANAIEMVMVLSDKATPEEAKDWVNKFMRF